MENEGLIVIGRPVDGELSDPETVQAIAATVDAWAQRTGTDLGLVWCGTTINWPDDMEFTPSIIGLITFSGFGDDDEPEAGEVTPEMLDGGRGASIPEELWSELEQEHGIAFDGETDVYLAAAGWTWVRMKPEGGKELAVSTEDDGLVKVPVEARGKSWMMRVGYC